MSQTGLEIEPPSNGFPSKKDVTTSTDVSIILVSEAEVEDETSTLDGTQEKTEPYKREILWFMVFKIFLLHVVGILSLMMVPFAQNATLVWTQFVIYMTMLGVQCGSHRLWAHRSYSANAGVRFLLCCCHALSMQESIYKWVRDHRVHHKFRYVIFD